MKKKGEAGYIHVRKKQVVLKTILEFGIVIALLVLGILQTGNRLNVLTVVAVVGCLPAAKAMVEMIMLLPHRTISEEYSLQIEMRGSELTRLYDLVFTSEKKVMPVDSIVLVGNTICGYTSSKKCDANFTAKHLQTYLHANHFSKVSIKIFEEFSEYIRRVEEMNFMAKKGEQDTRKHEESISRVLQNLSL